MSMQSILESIQESALAEWMRETNPAMQIAEATHVLAAVMLFGTVLIVDLRLLGLADLPRSLTRISRETLPLTWAAFAAAVLTGSLMFTTSAVTYFGNAAFQWKALALFGAGLNMVLFQVITARSAAAWDLGKPPRAAQRRRRRVAVAVGGRGSARPLDRLHERLRLHAFRRASSSCFRG